VSEGAAFSDRRGAEECNQRYATPCAMADRPDRALGGVGCQQFCYRAARPRHRGQVFVDRRCKMACHGRGLRCLAGHRSFMDDGCPFHLEAVLSKRSDSGSHRRYNPNHAFFDFLGFLTLELRYVVGRLVLDATIPPVPAGCSAAGPYRPLKRTSLSAGPMPDSRDWMTEFRMRSVKPAPSHCDGHGAEALDALLEGVRPAFSFRM
jgi:hypothetical protein